MATKKITELPLIQTISGSFSVVPIVIGNSAGNGTTDQITIENFSRFVTQYSAHTGSAGNTFTGPQIINSNVTINGRLTVTEVVAQYETASVIFSSGSNIFGDKGDDVHTFTGSVIYNGVILTNIDANTIQRLQQATASIQLASASFNYFYQSTASLQTFTASQADRNLVLSTVTGSINQATASIQFQTASLLQFTASQDSRNFTLSQVTGSFNYFYQATASLQTFTSSQADRNLVLSTVTGSINQATASLQFHSASVEAQLARIQQATASLELASASFKYFYQSTASLQTFTSSQADRNLVLSTVTGSINQATASLQQFTASQDSRNLTLSTVTGSLIGITNGLMAFTAALDNTYATDAQLYQLYQATRSLELLSGSMIGVTNDLMAYTASLKNSTIVSSSTQIFTGYDYEIHVSQVDGNDTTGNGDLLTPVASITKALQIVSSSYLSTDRRTIIIHPGTYTENPTVTLANTYIFALGLLGANTAIAGTLTINAACRVSGIKMTNLVVNTTSAVYINNTTVDTQMTVTNTGYLETTGCSFQCTSGVTVSGAAPAVIFNSTTLWGLVVSNASAVVIVRNSPQVLIATVTAGNLALSNTLLFSATPTGNAITTSAGSVVTLSNLNILDNTGLAVARVSLSGFYSIIDVVYDKPNSTLVALSGTGGPLNAIDYFQYINADKFITQGGTGYQFLKGDGSLDSTMPSSLQQTTASLNLTTGSIKAEIAGIEAYTASLKGAAIVSSSQQVQNYFAFALTSSNNSFFGENTFTNKVTHTNGYVVLSQVSASLNFVDDTAAASGGVPLGGLYRNGNFIVIRIV
jgi:hypothetical protein